MKKKLEQQDSSQLRIDLEKMKQEKTVKILKKFSEFSQFISIFRSH